MKKPDWVLALETATKKFWDIDYPAKNAEEKALYWQITMEKAMKEQEKSGMPIFEVFNAHWLASVREQEPNIEAILEQLFDRVWKDKSLDEFKAAIMKEEEEEEE